MAAVAITLLGVALVIRGAWGGVWPLSVQLIVGLLLVIYGVVRCASGGGGRCNGGRSSEEGRAPRS